jgi:hypothetical protein
VLFHPVPASLRPTNREQTMQRRTFITSLTATLAFAPFARAQDLLWSLTPDLLAELQAGGLNIFFRHGITQLEDAPDEPNLDTPRPGDCALERNLSQSGIDQMRGVGEAFYQLAIPVGIVRSSPACRCTDTAWWAFGRFERARRRPHPSPHLGRDPPDGCDAAHAAYQQRFCHPQPGRGNLWQPRADRRRGGRGPP